MLNIFAYVYWSFVYLQWRHISIILFKWGDFLKLLSFISTYSGKCKYKTPEYKFQKSLHIFSSLLRIYFPFWDDIVCNTKVLNFHGGCFLLILSVVILGGYTRLVILFSFPLESPDTGPIALPSLISVSLTLSSESFSFISFLSLSVLADSVCAGVKFS